MTNYAHTVLHIHGPFVVQTALTPPVVHWGAPLLHSPVQYIYVSTWYRCYTLCTSALIMCKQSSICLLFSINISVDIVDISIFFSFSVSTWVGYVGSLSCHSIMQEN